MAEAPRGLAFILILLPCCVFLLPEPLAVKNLPSLERDELVAPLLDVIGLGKDGGFDIIATANDDDDDDDDDDDVRCSTTMPTMMPAAELDETLGLFVDGIDVRSDDNIGG